MGSESSVVRSEILDLFRPTVYFYLVVLAFPSVFVHPQERKTHCAWL